jgi:Ca-activated chloride channel homolog
MRNKLLMAALLVLAAQARADNVWSHLWRNADQRGDALLQQGKAKDAAGEFADPRRKSYAEFKAGDYAAAARALSAFNDSDAHYNRGNALAHAGDLQGALGAYDAALKRDPRNQDAQHNRELVAKALKKHQEQQQKQQKESGKNSPQAGKQDQKQDQKQQGKPADNQSGKDSSSGNGQQQAQPSQSQNPKAGGQDAAQKKPDNPTDKADDAAQAKRDVDAGMQDSKQNQPGKLAQGDGMQNRNAHTAPAPLTEKQIAQDQWLRSIPNDPGGLLRRKFLIEHMLRQQRAQR